MNQLLAMLKLLPVLIAAITALEQVLPVSGAGQKKLDLVLAMIQDVYNSSAELKKAFTWEALAKLVTQTVGRMVELLNVFGVFTKGQPAEPAAVG